MSNTVISVENLSKTYRLGQIGRDTLSDDLKVWWAKVRGKPNPLLKIGMDNFGNLIGETIWALKDVSFSVEQGEILGIIGRNGAGKSTLLKVLSEVTAPTSGEVKIKGRIASLLEVGTGFHPDLTGRENIFLNGAILGMNKAEITRKFDEIVDFSGVEQFIDTPVKRYSSGMYVRLAFAVAAHLEPEILLVDEVLAVGDVEFQKKCLGKMGNVAKEGRTVLFVSHNMMAVKSLCDRSLLIDEGRIVESGETNHVISIYMNNGETNRDEIKWLDSDAPQNSYIQLKRVRVRSNGTVITVDDPVFIDIRFCNLKPVTMYLNFILRTALAEIVFESPTDSCTYDQGVYEVTWKIPPNLLNTAIYSIQINFTKIGPIHLFYHEDIIKFEVHEPKRTDGHYGKWKGFIRPKLDSNIRKVE
ncbi:polysaccharide ABC transporter ATP-binding protein [Chloroflexota bacterium]